MKKKSLAARLYRATANAVEPLLPKGARTPAHYLSRRWTNRLEAEYDATVAAKWRGIGIRTENDVAITRDGHEVLTDALARSADEIESLMAAG